MKSFPIGIIVVHVFSISRANIASLAFETMLRKSGVYVKNHRHVAVCESRLSEPCSNAKKVMARKELTRNFRAVRIESFCIVRESSLGRGTQERSMEEH